MNCGTFHVTENAAFRWIELARPGLNFYEAVGEIARHRAAIEMAIAFGSTSVKLGCGLRLVVRESVVVTVLGRGVCDPELMRPAAYGFAAAGAGPRP